MSASMLFNPICTALPRMEQRVGFPYYSIIFILSLCILFTFSLICLNIYLYAPPREHMFEQPEYSRQNRVVFKADAQD